MIRQTVEPLRWRLPAMPRFRLMSLLALCCLSLAWIGHAHAATRGIVIEPGSGTQTNRLALVIGNDYDGESGQLLNPVHDADDMRKTLSKLGFEVMGDNQQSLQDMNTLVREFGDRLRPGMVGLFYFAGHGMQINGQNYLIPIQSGIQREDEVPFRALAVDQVLAKMSKNKTGLNLMMLDACRDNPFARSFRSTTTGLAKMEAPSGTLISYAAKPGTRSKDGDGRNGLYTSVLLKYLPIPGMPIEQMLKKVGTEVRQRSGDQQQTWMEGLLDSGDGGDFCFAGCAGRAPTPTTPPYKAVEPKSAPKFDADPVSQRQTKAPAVKPMSTTTLQSNKACDFCPEMVQLPGGSFMMGSPSSEPGRGLDERQHLVTVHKFGIGKYEVTRGQFAAFAKATEHRTGTIFGTSCMTTEDGEYKGKQNRDWHNPGYSQGDNHPVVCVNIEDVEAYTRWLNEKTGKHYRLPTEAEWEYAARSGTVSSRYWGDSIEMACEYANLPDFTYEQKYAGLVSLECHDGAVHTAEVGSYRENQFRLFDMLGNIKEWTCSPYSIDYSGKETTCLFESNLDRVIRGGSWYSPPHISSVSHRERRSIYGRSNDLGFRLAQD